MNFYVNKVDCNVLEVTDDIEFVVGRLNCDNWAIPVCQLSGFGMKGTFQIQV